MHSSTWVWTPVFIAAVDVLHLLPGQSGVLTGAACYFWQLFRFAVSKMGGHRSSGLSPGPISVTACPDCSYLHTALQAA